jgi:tripartite-type tricarboxylate transporter receptor subunit TctC
MMHVPYKGTAPAVADLLAGHVQVQFQAVSQAMGNIAAGRVRPLGIAILSRHPSSPQIPPGRSSQSSRLRVSTSMGIFVAAKPPDAELTKLRAALSYAAAQPSVRKQLTDAGMRPISMSPDTVMARVKGDIDKWAPSSRKAVSPPTDLHWRDRSERSEYATAFISPALSRSGCAVPNG